MYRPDEKDARILNVLEENSRLSYRQIAKKANVSLGTVMNRIEKMKENSIIKKYSVIIDYEKLGYTFGVLIDVRVSRGRLFEVEERIAKNPNVLAIYDITGDFDVLVIARFKTRKELDNFVKHLQKMEYVERTNTKLILNYIKEEGLKFRTSLGSSGD